MRETEEHEAQPRVTLHSWDTNREIGEFPTTSSQWTLTLCSRSRSVTELLGSEHVIPDKSVRSDSDTTLFDCCCC